MRKRDNKSYSERIGPVDLYLDDVEEIYAAMAESGHPVNIETPDHIFDSIEELSQDGPRLMYLTVATGNARLHLQMDGSPGVWLYCASRDLAAVGVYYNVREALLRRRRRSTLLFHNPVVANALAILPAPSIAWIIGYGVVRDKPLDFYLPVAVIVAVTMALHMAKALSEGPSVLYTKRRRDVRPASERVWGFVAAHIVAPTVAAIVAGLVGFLLGRAGLR